MRSLIEALLSYSRISTESRQFESVDMNEAVREALTNLEGRIEETDAKIEAAELPAIEADKIQMVQLIQNLVGNALKFHREGGLPPIITIGCTIRQKRGKRKGRKPYLVDSCKITIADNGIGMDGQYINEIFLPFRRLHGRSEYEGAGMGLAICRRIVEKHGGNIRVESVPGKGSNFILTLPLKQRQQPVKGKKQRRR
jgi:light-regulated signal transduction histidine kinase (bacteriophytochrome)